MQNFIRFYAVAFSPYLHRMKVAASLVLLCTFWVTSAYAQAPAETPKPASKSIHVYNLAFTPLKRHGGPVVRVRLNDKIDANFLVDTGSGITVISTGLAKKLNLSLKQYVAPNNNTFPAGTKLALGVIENLNIGGSEAEAAVLVSDTVVQVADDKSVEGILGMNDLGTFALVFNFERNQLFLIEDGKLNDVMLNTFGAKGGVAAGIPIHSTPDKLNLLFTVPAFVEGKRYDLRIDSGSSSTTLPSLGAKIKILLKPKSRSFQLRTISGVGTITDYPIPSFNVGSTVAANRLSPFECGVGSNLGEASASLGVDYLSHFQFILDCPAQRMYLTSIDSPANPLFPTEASCQSAMLNKADLLIKPSAKGNWFVVSTESNKSYGKAGIRAGDIIEQINGETVAGKLSCEVGVLFDKNDKATRMLIIRDGKPLKINVPTKISSL